MSSAALGLATGTIAAALALVGNVLRADPHLVSTFPDVISLATVPLIVTWTVRRARLEGVPALTALSAARRVVVIAAAVFAATMAVFTWWWLPTGSQTLAAFSATTGFVVVFVLGDVAAQWTVRLIAARRTKP